jgi:hypothetical protein
MNADKMASMKIDHLKKYEFKEEFSRIPFNPNVRHRVPTMPNHL